MDTLNFKTKKDLCFYPVAYIAIFNNYIVCVETIHIQNIHILYRNILHKIVKQFLHYES